MRYSLTEIAETLGAKLLSPGSQGIGEAKDGTGDATDVTVTGVASFESAGAGDLVFVEDAKLLTQALESKAAAVIASPAAATLLTATGAAGNAHLRKPILIADQPKLAFARAAALLAEQQPVTLGVHPTAIVHGDAKLGLGVSVGPHAVIEKGAVIGARTRISAGVVIGAGVAIGNDCVIAANVCIYSGSTLKERIIIHAGCVLGSDGFGFVRDNASGKYEKFPQIGRLEIGDDVEIGANSTIDRGALGATVIGRGTKLDNLVHVGHNVRIGEDVVIAAQTGVSGSSVIGNEAIIGGQVGIADHVTIEDGVILGAQCGVPTGKVLRGKGTVYWGTPARPIKGYLKELAALARLGKK